MIRPVPVPTQWSYACLGDRLLARFDDKATIEHVVTDHIGYPMATISAPGEISGNFQMGAADFGR